jgi:hypothetical protein
MKTLVIASLALLVIGGTAPAMIPAMSESGQHIRSLPTIDTQPQDQPFKGDIVAPQNGPMLAPFMPFRPPASSIC